MTLQSHVVVQTAFIGDLFLSILFLQHLRKINPEHKLILVCKKGLGEVLLQEGFVDEVIEIEKSSRSSYQEALEKLKDVCVDHVFCLHRSTRSSFFVAQMKARKKIGFRNFLNFFIFSKTMAYIKKWPDVARQLYLLAAVDKDMLQKLKQTDWTYLNFKEASGYFPKIPDFLKFQNDQSSRSVASKKIAVFPGSVWETKKWTQEGFSTLVEKILAAGHSVALMGAPNEALICNAIQRKNSEVLNFAGELSLAQTYNYLKSCDVVICNDSAPAHMAASLNIPVLSIFGPTTLALGFRPWNDKSIVVENENLNCRPCGAHGHQQCPLGHHKCMQELTVEQVFTAFKKIN